MTTVVPTPAPPVQSGSVPIVIPPAVSPSSLSQYTAGPSTPPPYTTQLSPDQTVQNSLNSFMNPNSQYIQDARQSGMDYANTRGGLNSSIAAGASERSAIGAAMPLVQSSLDIQKQRDALSGQNWLETQGFNRQFQGAMAMLPVTSAFHMLDTVQQYAMQDPALYTPDVISGYSNFFQGNMNNIMDKYFSNNSIAGGH